MPKKRSAWNKDRSVRPRTPLGLVEVQEIVIFLSLAEKWRDLCLFVVAVETMLRSSDLLKLRILDISDSSGNIYESFIIRQRKSKSKTYKEVKVCLSELARSICRHWISISGKRGEDFLFTRLKGDTRSAITRYHYSCLIKGWVRQIGLDPTRYSTHSLRRTRSEFIYDAFKDPELNRIVLGHASLTSTSYYLGLDWRKAHKALQAVPLFPASFRLEGEGTDGAFLSTQKPEK